MRALKIELMTLAYQRTNGDLYNYPLGVYNGVNRVNGICGTWRSPYPQKRDVGANDCTINNAVVSTTSSATSSIRASRSPSPSPSSPATSNPQYFTTVKSRNSSLVLGFNASSYLTAFGSYLRDNCPASGQNCSETGQIENIYSYDGESIVQGTLDITIPFSQWENANQLYAMEVLAVKALSNSESNCHLVDKQDGDCFEVGGNTPCVNHETQVCQFTDFVEVVVNGFDSGLSGQLVSLHPVNRN